MHNDNKWRRRNNFSVNVKTEPGSHSVQEVKDPMSIISMPDYLSGTRPIIPLTNVRQFDKPIYSGKENLAYIKLDTGMAEYEKYRGMIMNNYYNIV